MQKAGKGKPSESTTFGLNSIFRVITPSFDLQELSGDVCDTRATNILVIIGTTSSSQQTVIPNEFKSMRAVCLPIGIGFVSRYLAAKLRLSEY